MDPDVFFPQGFRNFTTKIKILWDFCSRYSAGEQKYVIRIKKVFSVCTNFGIAVHKTSIGGNSDDTSAHKKKKKNYIPLHLVLQKAQKASCVFVFLLCKFHWINPNFKNSERYKLKLEHPWKKINKPCSVTSVDSAGGFLTWTSCPWQANEKAFWLSCSRHSADAADLSVVVRCSCSTGRRLIRRKQTDARSPNIFPPPAMLLLLTCPPHHVLLHPLFLCCNEGPQSAGRKNLPSASEPPLPAVRVHVLRAHLLIDVAPLRDFPLGF